MAELRARRDAAVAPIVELRLDGVADLDVKGALDGRRTPVLVACHPSWEGGRFDGSEEERLGILSEASQLGAEFVDVEWKADRRRFSAKPSTEVVLSWHDFAGIPSDLASGIDAMRREHPAIVKVAVMAKRVTDCLTLRDAFGREDDGRVAIAMGSRGQLTRFCPWLFGSRWTYGGTAAPGQVSARDLIEVYRVSRGTPATALYAVVGAPIGHSASPAMHNAAFSALGMDAVYVPLETADGDEVLAVAEALGFVGMSVTAPLKPAVYARVPSSDPLSRETGAVNTIRRASGPWEARNFDAAGFLAPLDRRGVPLTGVRAVVIGAGGAARTVAWALASRGARVEISARRSERGSALAAELGVRTVPWPPPTGWDLLVNTTPVGTWPRDDESPLAPASISGRRVYDLIYNPEETTLLRLAREAGAETIGGLEMLVGQAVCQFEWWTGRQAPAAIMEEAARAFVAARRTDHHDAHHV